MAAQESSVRGGRIGAFFGVVFTLIGILVLLGIGYVYWPKVKAAYYAAPAAAEQPVALPTADTSALDAIKAQLKRVEAELAAARDAAAQPPIVVQSVEPGDAPPAEPKVTIPQQPATTEGDQSLGKPESPPPAAPIVIVQHEGYQQPVITGSGACAVAARGARRCFK